MMNFLDNDLEGNGVQFSIGDIRLKVWGSKDNKFNCRVQYSNLVCGSTCKSPEKAIRSAVGKLAWYLIEHGYIATISDKDGGDWFCKAFMGDHKS